MYTTGIDRAPTDVNSISATSSLTTLPDAGGISPGSPSEHGLATDGNSDASGEADNIATRPQSEQVVLTTGGYSINSRVSSPDTNRLAMLHYDTDSLGVVELETGARSSGTSQNGLKLSTGLTD